MDSVSSTANGWFARGFELSGRVTSLLQQVVAIEASHPFGLDEYGVEGEKNYRSAGSADGETPVAGSPASEFGVQDLAGRVSDLAADVLYGMTRYESTDGVSAGRFEAFEASYTAPPVFGGSGGSIWDQTSSPPGGGPLPGDGPLPATMTDADGNTVTVDDQGRLDHVTYRDGKAVDYTYDGDNVQLAFSEGGSIEWRQPPGGESTLLSTTDDKGNVTTFDGQGRPDLVVLHDGKSMDYTFLSEGVRVDFSEGGSMEYRASPEPGGESTLVSTTDEGGNITTFDGQGRPIQVAFHDGQTMVYAYDGDRVQVAFSEGGSIMYLPPPEPGGGSTLVSTTDQEGNIYSNFDDRGRPGHVDLRDGGWADYTYLVDGRIQVRLASGETVMLGPPAEMV
jgi:hypothetical protein